MHIEVILLTYICKLKLFFLHVNNKNKTISIKINFRPHNSAYLVFLNTLPCIISCLLKLEVRNLT